MITVKQLREHLLQFPDDMPVICTRYSDYRSLNDDLAQELQVIEVCKVKGSAGEWFMGKPYYESLRENELASPQDYRIKDTPKEHYDTFKALHFAGN